MACTTILVGKKASYDGSTMIARNDDSGSGHFTPKKFVVYKKRSSRAVINPRSLMWRSNFRMIRCAILRCRMR